MALLDTMFEGWGPSVLIGVGVALAAPILFPTLAAGGRPLAKTLVKSYLVMADAVSEVVAEAGEQLSDLVAEARAEREAAAKTATTAPEPSRIFTAS
jgi:Protein of unknown function (DUF5132)